MNWRLTTRPFGSYVFLWIGLGLLMLTVLLIGGAASSRESDGWVVHTLEVLQRLERFESAMIQADVLSRAALPTEAGRQKALSELEEAQNCLQTLAKLTADNPSAAIRIKVLQSLTNQAAGSIRTRVQSNAPMLVPSLIQSIQSTLPLSETINEIRAEERALLAKRQQTREKNDAAFWRTTAFAMALNLGLLLWSYVASRAYVRERNAREYEISGLNRKLAEQVAEIQDLNSSLESRIREKTSELENTVVKLNGTNAELERFAYVASHDLQEPLRQVASFNNLLSMKYGDRLDENAQRYLSYSVAGAKRLQLMIRALHQYTVISSSPLHVSMFPAARLVERVTHDLAPQMKASNATLDVKMPEEGITISGDEALIRNVVEALVSNAIRFGRKDVPPLVTLCFERTGHGKWRLRVRDNGSGVDRRFAGRMFEMFARDHSVGVFSGAGAGLAIAKKIVGKHGGTLEVDFNQDEPGLTFTAEFPLAASVPKALETSHIQTKLMVD